jgi:endoglucanase
MTRRLAKFAVVVAVAVSACSSSPPDRVADASDRFFGRFVTDIGRVVRHDQGGDTVSEGQAYALLLAVENGDRERFERVWRWTRANLQRDDHLFAWHWEHSRIADDSPAADADVDIAYALLLAAQRFENEQLGEAGREVADAVLDKETIESPSGRVLVAGPWARSARTINPSYLAICAFGELGERTGDDRWHDVARGSLAVMRALLRNGGLPPDWARIDEHGAVRPMAAPDTSGAEPTYGLDAVRVAPRLASCRDGRELAASMWPRLHALRDGGAAIAYSLDGAVRSGVRNAAGLVGAAAAAQAAGATNAALRLLDRAAALERARPTYFGSAWLAMGP